MESATVSPAKDPEAVVGHDSQDELGRDEELDEQDLAESLLEDVSIDGMCGVY